MSGHLRCKIQTVNKRLIHVVVRRGVFSTGRSGDEGGRGGPRITDMSAWTAAPAADYSMPHDRLLALERDPFSRLLFLLLFPGEHAPPLWAVSHHRQAGGDQSGTLAQAVAAHQGAH